MKYDDLQTALKQCDANFLAAESHGMVCGLLAANNTADTSICTEMVLGDVVDAGVAQAASTHLKTLCSQSLEELQNADFSIQLLLPNEDAALPERLTALQEWCRGFLVGVSLAGIKEFEKLPKDTHEIIKDFAQISTSGEFDLSDTEVSEQAFMEIEEFVSVSVLLVNEELQPIIAQPQIH